MDINDIRNYIQKPPPPQNQYNMYKNNTQYNGRAQPRPPPPPQNQYNKKNKYLPMFDFSPIPKQ